MSRDRRAAVHELRIRPCARQDLVDLAIYIANDNPDAAERFVVAVRDSCDLLCHNPGIGAVYSSSELSAMWVRVWPVSGFKKHLIFYHVDEDGVEVLRVLHASRDLPAILELDE